MRAFALLLASALIVALVWFVSYKNGCVSCSSCDTTSSADDGGRQSSMQSPTPTPAPSSLQSCSKKSPEDDGNNTSGGDNNVTSSNDITGIEDNVDNGVSAAEDTENKKVSFEVVIDGRSTRFEIDLDSLEDHKINVTSEDGVSAVFEKGTSTDVKVVVDTENAVRKDTPDTTGYKPEPADDAAVQEPVDEQPADEQPADEQPVEENGAPAAEEPVEEAQPASDIQNNSDIASPAEAQTEPEYVAEPEVIQPAPVIAPFNASLPAVTLLDGADFGMEGRVLALGKGSERRDAIVAVIPEEGNTVALLCETRATQKTINAVKDQYPGKIVYTYTIDREFFVNLRGNSRFALHNCGDRKSVV